MIFAQCDPGPILLVGLLYFTVGIGSLIAMIWSFLRPRRSFVLLVCAVISILFGAGLAGLFLNDGTSLSEDLPDWLFALVPLLCGIITCLRFICVKPKPAA